jgi:aminopeptidase C
MPRWKNSTWTNTHNMALITASQARELTQSREQQVESFIKPWREVFNTKLKVAAQGTRSTEGKCWMLFEISAASQILKMARDVFLQEIRESGFVVHLHDQEDDEDYFVYQIDWS